jgi:signal transduction histidine kinase
MSRTLLLIEQRQNRQLLAEWLSQRYEVVLRPMEKVELQSRVEILLRARQLSVTLQRQHDDLEAFLHAMTHELRAPLRAIMGFAQEVGMATCSTEHERHCWGRITATATQAQGLITALLTFGRLGHEAVKRRPGSARSDQELPATVAAGNPGPTGAGRR